MAKNKEQKKKERERRVAQKKHAAALKRAQEEKTSGQSATSFPQQNKFTPDNAAPKTPYVAANTKKPFNYRRTGG